MLIPTRFNLRVTDSLTLPVDNVASPAVESLAFVSGYSQCKVFFVLKKNKITIKIFFSAFPLALNFLNIATCYLACNNVCYEVLIQVHPLFAENYFVIFI
jgi:hypothetical protein